MRPIHNWHVRRMARYLVVVCWTLFIVSSANAEPRIYFDQTEYLVTANGSLEVNLLFDADDATERFEPLPNGLFSYGVLLQFDASKAQAESAILPLELDFFGLDAGAFQAVNPGSLGVKANVDVGGDTVVPYSNSLLATIPLSNLALPSDNYSLDISLFQSLGPTDQVILDGDGVVLDAQVSFESAVVRVTGGGGITGDFNRDGQLDIEDLTSLCAEISVAGEDTKFDLNGDQQIDGDDLRIWVEDIKATFIGDANLDGQFSSRDLVAVFTAGEYDDNRNGNSTWAEGDWNCDGDFDSRDFVAAFASGGYEQGPRRLVGSPVPEPTPLPLLFVFACWAYRVETPARE